MTKVQAAENALQEAKKAAWIAESEAMAEERYEVAKRFYERRMKFIEDNYAKLKEKYPEWELVSETAEWTFSRPNWSLGCYQNTYTFPSAKIVAKGEGYPSSYVIKFGAHEYSRSGMGSFPSEVQMYCREVGGNRKYKNILTIGAGREAMINDERRKKEAAKERMDFDQRAIALLSEMYPGAEVSKHYQGGYNVTKRGLVTVRFWVNADMTVSVADIDFFSTATRAAIANELLNKK